MSGGAPPGGQSCVSPAKFLCSSVHGTPEALPLFFVRLGSLMHIKGLFNLNCGHLTPGNGSPHPSGDSSSNVFTLRFVPNSVPFAQTHGAGLGHHRAKRSARRGLQVGPAHASLMQRGETSRAGRIKSRWDHSIPRLAGSADPTVLPGSPADTGGARPSPMRAAWEVD
jgi:hypothetical protein